MNLTSILSTAAGGWIPMAASAATSLASKMPFASWLGGTDEASAAPPAASGAIEPEFPLSSSDRDRLERLLQDDLDSLANLLRADPKSSLDDGTTFDVTLDASGQAKITANGIDGSSHEVDLGGSDELTSLLNRMTSCLRRLSPNGGEEQGANPSAANSSWNIRVDSSGARLSESL